MKKVEADSSRNQWQVLWNDMLGRDFWKKFLILAVVAALSSGATFLVDGSLFEQKCDSNLKLVTSDVMCNKAYVISKAEYLALRDKISSYIADETTSGHVMRAGVYFRDLDNGPTMGINEKDKFVPASLLKVPLMLTYLNMADDTSDILDEKLGFEWMAPPDLEQFFKPSHTIAPETPHTVNELLYNMIAYSDNASYYVLLQHLKDIDPAMDTFFSTFQDLGIIDPTSDLDQSISTKSYASLFRALYNASYLSKASSEKALELLAASDFNDGLIAGIPAGIKVAHKFGERYGITGNEKELHDCGIIYYPGNPYLLCVMTEGPDYPALATVIQNISRMVYAEVDSRKL